MQSAMHAHTKLLHNRLVVVVLVRILVVCKVAVVVFAVAENTIMVIAVAFSMVFAVKIAVDFVVVSMVVVVIITAFSIRLGMLDLVVVQVAGTILMPTTIFHNIVIVSTRVKHPWS